MGLHAAHAPVLRVHVEEEQQEFHVAKLLEPLEQIEPRQVDGQDEQYVPDDHGRRVNPELASARSGNGPAAFVLLFPVPETGQVSARLVHDDRPGHQARGRHQPGVQPPVRGGQVVVAPAVQHAHAPRRVGNVQQAGHEHPPREPPFESVVRHVQGEHAARAPETRSRPHQHAAPYRGRRRHR